MALILNLLRRRSRILAETWRTEDLISFKPCHSYTSNDPSFPVQTKEISYARNYNGFIFLGVQKGVMGWGEVCFFFIRLHTVTMRRSALLAVLGLALLLSSVLAASHCASTRTPSKSAQLPASLTNPFLLFVDGEKVIRFHLSSEEEAHRVFNLASTYNLDVWSENRALGRVDVRLSTLSLPELLPSLSGLRYEVVVEDVQRLIDDSMALNAAALQDSTLKASSGGFDPSSFFKAYHPYSEIIDFLHTMNTTYPSLTRLETIGSSVEGLPIVGIHISTGPFNNGTKKPLIVYNSLQHAREWISGAVTTYIIDQLLSGYGKTDSVTKMLAAVDFFIIPVVNVDGYKYTWDPRGDRMWRKNRRPTSNGCVGIDINRNWDFQFKASPSYQLCDEIYAGTKGFSEPENSAVGFFLKNHPETVAYIDFHAYSQLLMWPWAYTSNPPPSNHDLVPLGTKMAQVIQEVHGTKFTYGQLYQTIYPAYGSSIDYALAVAGVPLPFAIELRDTGTYGFLLPPSQIVPSGQEIWAGVQTMANYIAQNRIHRL